MAFDPKHIDLFPTQPGVYLMKNQEGKVIYVGKAKNLKQRLKQYFLSSHDNRAMIPLLVEQTCAIDTLLVPTEKEALLLENTLIKKHQPKFNAVLKDDKTFISLMINPSEQWPHLRLVRYKEAPQAKGLFFGPYPSGYAARTTYEVLTRLFPLRQCSDAELRRRTKPCLLYDIKRCLAPCVAKCTKSEYDELVARTVQFLKGQDDQILQGLYTQMQEAAEALDFEKAAALLQTARQLEEVLKGRSLVAKVQGKACDVIGLYQQGGDALVVVLLFREGKLVGSESYAFSHTADEETQLLSSFLLQHYPSQQERPEEILLPFSLDESLALEEILSCALLNPVKGDKKAMLTLAAQNAQTLFFQKKQQALLDKELLFDLQVALKLNRYPKQIVCFDTAHTAGSDPCAAMAVFTEGSGKPKRGKLFTIKEAKAGDDYGALAEVLTRYLRRAKQEDALPDLLLIDGGKGQLGVATKVLKELDIACVDYVAITKEEGRHDKGIRAERIFLPDHPDALSLNPRSPLLFFLQTLRDTAHDNALRFHKKRTAKRLLTSSLDQLPGIGPIKKKRLLKELGSLKQILAASDETLKAINGITDKDIAAIRTLLKG